MGVGGMARWRDVESLVLLEDIVVREGCNWELDGGWVEFERLVSFLEARPGPSRRWVTKYHAASCGQLGPRLACLPRRADRGKRAQRMPNVLVE